MNTQSGNNFAHAMTAQLSWHVQNCYMIGSLEWILEEKGFLWQFQFYDNLSNCEFTGCLWDTVIQHARPQFISCQPMIFLSFFLESDLVISIFHVILFYMKPCAENYFSHLIEIIRNHIRWQVHIIKKWPNFKHLIYMHKKEDENNLTQRNFSVV